MMGWSAKSKEGSTTSTPRAEIAHPRERSSQGLRSWPCCRLLWLTEWQRSYDTILVKCAGNPPSEVPGNLRSRHFATKLPKGGPGKAAGHCELQKPSTGESNVSWRSFPSKHTRMRKQKLFPPCNVFPVPSNDKVPASKEKYLKGRYLFTQSWQISGLWS